MPKPLNGGMGSSPCPYFFRIIFVERRTEDEKKKYLHIVFMYGIVFYNDDNNSICINTTNSNENNDKCGWNSGLFCTGKFA